MQPATSPGLLGSSLTRGKPERLAVCVAVLGGAPVLENGVVSGAAVDVVDRSVVAAVGVAHVVVAGAAEDVIRAAPARRGVAASASPDEVLARAAGDLIVGEAARKEVAPAGPRMSSVPLYR